MTNLNFEAGRFIEARRIAVMVMVITATRTKSQPAQARPHACRHLASRNGTLEIRRAGIAS